MLDRLAPQANRLRLEVPFLPVRVETASTAPSGWDAFVRAHPDGTFFHQGAWLGIIRDVYRGEPHYLTAYDGDDIVGILPLMDRWAIGRGHAIVSVPFADVGGICSDDGGVTDALVSAASDLGKSLGVRCVELRQVHPIPKDLPCDQTRVTMVRPLPDNSGVLWDELKAKVRNRVRKAERSELVCTVGGDELIPEFYRIYARNTRDLGSPMHSIRFFREIHCRMGDSLRVLRVKRGQEAIGGGIAVWHNSTMSVPWAGSLRAHRSLCANNLLYWQAFQLAIDCGCRWFDFGRSVPDSGTYRFKKQWGSEERQLYYQFIPITGQPALHERRDGLAYRAFSRVWQYTPLPIACLVGPRLFRRLPI